jgi:hypothetical protein
VSTLSLSPWDSKTLTVVTVFKFYFVKESKAMESLIPEVPPPQAAGAVEKIKKICACDSKSLSPAGD